ncbi:MAG: monovalent cation/H+ antiporter subunit D family protein [Candidatus Omnitrophota bacterium]|nr:monovalent cation/H+ antiporter subunit D family protein [Candidatus Omnitrophota bacterium]
MEVASIRPLLAVLVSAAASLGILASNRNRTIRETWTFAAASIKFIIVLSMLPAIFRGNILTFKILEITPGIICSFRVDALGIFFALVASVLWIITSWYSVGYMRALKEKEQTRYFFSFALSLTATMGIAFAGDLITFFAFYEMLALATYPLVAHKESREAVLAGRKYLVYSLTAGALLLFAITWTLDRTGTVAFTPGGLLAGSFSSKELLIVFALFIYGCGVKAALFPVHAWLPSAMVAPTPVSALLHAVAVVKAGVFGILRIVGFVFGPELLDSSGLGRLLAGVAAFTILYASCMALAQDNLKRRLAYSTISQLSYIILGAALVTPAAYLGSIMHLANHAMMKITLFFCAGVIYAKTHLENISDMGGIGRKLPWTLTAFTIGTLGLSGFPPFSGFISKWLLCEGAVEAEGWVFLAVYLTSSLLNAAYLLPVVFKAFGPPGTKQITASEKGIALVWPPLATATLVILFGIVPFFILTQIDLARIASSSVFGP